MANIYQIEDEEKRDQEINQKLDLIQKILFNLNLDIKKIKRNYLIPPIKWLRLLFLAEISLTIITFYPTSNAFLNPIAITIMVIILIIFIIKTILYFKK
jgi:hypothetical protein